MIIRLIQILASLTILVVIHEFGHFCFARLFKIRVEKFYIFFNPFFTLFKFKPKNSDTEYGLGWLPLGGYTKIAGMIDESMDTEQMKRDPQPWEFRSHPAWHRLLVMAGGVLFNVVLALFLYSAICYVWGDRYLPMKNLTCGLEFSETAKKAGFVDGDVPVSADDEELLAFDESSMLKIIKAKVVNVMRNGETTAVYVPNDMMQQLMRDNQGFATPRFRFVADSVMASSPAMAAGIKSADTIVAVNGRDMYVYDVMTTINNNAGKQLSLTVLRGGDTLTLKATPDAEGKIGIYLQGPQQMFKTESVSYSLLQSVPAGLNKAWDKMTGYVSNMKYIFTKEGATSVGGFGTMAKLFPQMFNWFAFWNMTAFLSIILAVMNILPIPALDGGHIMFLLYEVVTGRKPEQSFMEKAQMIGMMFLLFLFLYANLSDLFRAFM